MVRTLTPVAKRRFGQLCRVLERGSVVVVRNKTDRACSPGRLGVPAALRLPQDAPKWRGVGAAKVDLQRFRRQRRVHRVGAERYAAGNCTVRAEIWFFGEYV